MWRVVRAHLFGEVPIEALDLPGVASKGAAVPPERESERESDAGMPADDATVDEASAESFPASDPPSFTATRV